MLNIKHTRAKAQELMADAKSEPTIFCSYEEGMFGHDEIASEGPEGPEGLGRGHPMLTAEEIAYHEAGHAVLTYALGHGPSRIQLTVFESCRTGQILGIQNGMVAHTKQFDCVFTAGVPNDNYNRRALLHLGVIKAAGPAAQRKYCLRKKLPVQLPQQVNGDHESIQEIDNWLCLNNGRRRGSFSRLVWRKAQLAHEIPVIWQGVEALAQELLARFPESPLEEGEGGFEKCVVQIRTLPGATARAIIRRAGVRPGMLETLVAPWSAASAGEKAEA